MLCRRSWTICCRRFSSENGGKTKTAIVLLHEGQPRTEFYAKDFLKNTAAEYYNVPEKLRRNIPESLLVNDIVRKCVEDYGERFTIEDSLSNLASHVEIALNSLVPEFGNISVTSLFPSRSNTFTRNIEAVLNSGIDQLVVAPVVPHFSCSHSGILLNIVAEHLLKTTVPLPKDGQPLENVRVRPNTNISFTVSTIHRWSSHPTVAEYWIDHLDKSEREYDGIVFASPAMRGYGRTEYQRSLASSCERIANNISRNVPWKIGFYNGWNEWSLPLCDSLNKQIKKLSGKQNDRKRVAVVPVSDLFPNFNTTTVLPRYLTKHGNSFLVRPSDNNQILEQGLAEVIKNHLLGRRNAQLSQYCDNCNRKSCEATKLILAQV